MLATIYSSILLGNQSKWWLSIKPKMRVLFLYIYLAILTDGYTLSFIFYYLLIQKFIWCV